MTDERRETINAAVANCISEVERCEGVCGMSHRKMKMQVFYDAASPVGDDKAITAPFAYALAEVRVRVVGVSRKPVDNGEPTIRYVRKVKHTVPAE